MVNLLLAGVLLWATSPAMPQDVVVRTALVPAQCEVGAPFEWRIEVEDRVLADVGLEFPDWPDALDGDLLRRGVQGPEWSRAEDGRQRVTYRVTLVARRPGPHAVPAATVVLEESGQRIRTDSPVVSVGEPLSGWVVQIQCSTRQVVPGEVFLLRTRVSSPGAEGGLGDWRWEELPLPPWQYEVLSERNEEEGPRRWRLLELVARPGVTELLAARPGRLVVAGTDPGQGAAERVVWCEAADLSLAPLPPLPAGVLQSRGVGAWKLLAQRVADAHGALRGVELRLEGPGAERASLPDLREVRSLSPQSFLEERRPGLLRTVTWFEEVPQDLPPVICAWFDPVLRGHRVHRADLPRVGPEAAAGDGWSRWVGLAALWLGVAGILGATLGRALAAGRRRRALLRGFLADQPRLGLEQALCRALARGLGGAVPDWKSQPWERQMQRFGHPHLASQAARLQDGLQQQVYGAGGTGTGDLAQQSAALLEALD